jgi:hypothetical protein
LKLRFAGFSAAVLLIALIILAAKLSRPRRAAWAR